MENQFQQNNMEKPKKSYWKFVLKFLEIIVAVFVVFISGSLLWQKYDLWQGQKAVQRLAEGLKKIEQEDYEAAMADTYGGKTPQETLQMYIDAVEKSDYELASKYFVLDKQEEWKSELLEIEQVDKINIFLNPLKEAQKSKGGYSADKKRFSISEPIGVDFFLYPNGIWKISKI